MKMIRENRKYESRVDSIEFTRFSYHGDIKINVVTANTIIDVCQ